MANRLVINSSAALEDSISRVLFEEVVVRLMCEQWIKESKSAITWTRLATNKIREHQTARMAQEQQSSASGALASVNCNSACLQGRIMGMHGFEYAQKARRRRCGTQLTIAKVPVVLVDGVERQ